MEKMRVEGVLEGRGFHRDGGGAICESEIFGVLGILG